MVIRRDIAKRKKVEQHEDSWDKYSDPFSIPYKAQNICKNFTVGVLMV